MLNQKMQLVGLLVSLLVACAVWGCAPKSADDSPENENEAVKNEPSETLPNSAKTTVVDEIQDSAQSATAKGFVSPTKANQDPSKSVPLKVPFDPAQAKAAQRATAESLGKKVVETNKFGMKLVLIPPGTSVTTSRDGVFEVLVPVTLTQPFYIGQTEVTQGQWKQVMGTTPWEKKKNVKEGQNFPATHISREDAMKFCEKLNSLQEDNGVLPDGWSYSLPTDAQWEYACRAGTESKHFFDREKGELVDYAWFEDNTSDVDESYPHEVAKKLPNPFGLFDIYGNVAETCRDDYKEFTSGGTDPEITDPDELAVARGGSWDDWSFFCNSKSRKPCFSNIGRHDTGLRVAAVPPKKQPN